MTAFLLVLDHGSDSEQLGMNSQAFKNGHRKLKIQTRMSPRGKAKSITKAKKPKNSSVMAARRDHPESTNVSSPLQAASKRRIANHTFGDHRLEQNRNDYVHDDFVVSDKAVSSDEESDEDDAFEPVREAGKPRMSRKAQLGPPITADEQMDRLNETHRMIVDDFMVHAKRECERVNHVLLRFDFEY